MSLILDFSAHATKSRRRAARGKTAGSAEIVIFPGVRYERYDDAPVAMQKRRAKQRDRIELPD